MAVTVCRSEPDPSRSGLDHDHVDYRAPQPAISIDNVSQIDGNSGTTNFVFDVSLSAPSLAAVAVNYATADGTAMSGAGQYVPTSGTLTFNPGVTSGQITVQVPGSNSVAPTETFTVNLSDPRNATISNGTGTGTIVDVRQQHDGNGSLRRTPTRQYSTSRCRSR